MNAANDIDGDLITVNIFFAHLLKEMDIRRYGDDVRKLPTNNTVDIHRYSNAMSKFMADDSSKTYDETYSKKADKLRSNVGRHPNNTDNSKSDENLDDRIGKF